MEKLPCKECGTPILPATAESTGGICMACKQGIRQDIERSRAYYKARSEYDPLREFWKSLVSRSSSDPRLTTFSSSEKTYFSTCLLEGEVYNGGFDQYFSNSSGDHYQDAVFGLAELGASESLTILLRASEAIFGKSAPPEDRTERCKVMKTNLWSRSVAEQELALDGFDRKFCEDPDKLADLLAGYAEAHKLVEPFKR